ncbi:MAG: hypothetical protein ACYC6Y_20760 [Thermoguttaceae bacterium]
MCKKYVVRLSEEERQVRQNVVKKLKGPLKVDRAQILLKADADGPNWTDMRIAEAFHCRVQTVENLRERRVNEGFEAALSQKVRERSHVRTSSRSPAAHYPAGVSLR